MSRLLMKASGCKKVEGKTLRHLPFLLVALLSSLVVLFVCAYTFVAAADSKSESLKPSGIHEDCMELVPGQSLDYSFEASKPLDFNIHYHEDHQVVYGIEKDGVSSDRGTFRCEKKQYYCLMWTNRGTEPAGLTYSYTIRAK